LELKNLILNNIETEYTNNKVTTTNNNNKNKSLRPNSVKESMAFNLMNKSIKQFNNKINFYENLNYQEIPDNKLYNCLIKIIDTMKNSKDYKIVSGVNNTLLSNNMKILPLQNKEFRKDFMDKLFNNYELLQAFEEGETEFVNKPFNKHLFDK
jgi:CHAT domain-containing protein